MKLSDYSTKATPVDADSLVLVDSAASNAVKRVTWANVKSVLAGVFRTDTWTLSSKSSNYSVVAGDHNTLFTATANLTFTLPASAGCTAGKTRFGFRNDAGDEVYVARAGSDTIHGFNPQSSAQISTTSTASSNSESYLELLYIGSGKWVATSILGNWS